MKKARKGFTLVELMIVIGIIAILGAMGVVGGKEATNIAKVTNIVDGFKKIEAVMNMYYSSNYATSDAGKTKLADLIEGTKAHIKDADETITAAGANGAASMPATRMYTIVLEQTENKPEKWWLLYTLPDEEITTLGPILKTKATIMKFKSTNTIESGQTEAAAYDGTGASVYMQVR